MASLTTEFYKVKLMRRNTKREEDYKEIERILEEIFKEHAAVHGDRRSIDISPGILATSVEPKEVMDIFKDDKYCFGRICRKKSNNAMLKRDYETLEAKRVLEDNALSTTGIEIFTFFILDYMTGILSIVNAKGAPNKKAFNALLDNYYKEYDFEFEDIPNTEGIYALYASTRPEISRLEFEIPSPNPEFLQRVLGIDADNFGEMIEDTVYRANIILSPVPYTKLVINRGKVRDILDTLIASKNLFTKTKIRGKSEKFGSKDFDLHSRYFTYPIEVRNTRVIGGKTVEYSFEEIIEQYQYGLHMAYEANYDIINAIANRGEDKH